jgi:hypothetical protein
MIDLNSLLKKAFFVDKVHVATESIEKAREKFIAETKTDGLSLEYVVPSNVDAAWIRDRVAHSVVYFCESTGRPLPKCAGTFISLFVGDQLHAIKVPDFIEWVSEQLGVNVDQLRDQYGTHEGETVQRQ